jgi:AAA ATPase domain
VDELIERDDERAALDEAVAAAKSGAGRLLVIEAAPGLGKTRLLRTLQDRPGVRVLRARGSELESKFAFGVVHQLLDAVVLGSPHVFEGAARLAQPIFTEAPRPEADELLPLLHGLAWLVTGLAADTPLVLLVDDAQWADEPSRRFLAFLAKRIDGVPILLAVGTRPTDDLALAELTNDPEARVLKPAPLSAEGTRAFLEHANLDPAFAGACHASTGGNPFYLGELARELPAPNVTALGPRTIAAAIKRRIAPDALALARAVAVLGDGADITAAAQLAAITNPD